MQEQTTPTNAKEWAITAQARLAAARKMDRFKTARAFAFSSMLLMCFALYVDSIYNFIDLYRQGEPLVAQGVVLVALTAAGFGCAVWGREMILRDPESIHVRDEGNRSLSAEEIALLSPERPGIAESLAQRGRVTVSHALALLSAEAHSGAGTQR